MSEKQKSVAVRHQGVPSSSTDVPVPPVDGEKVEVFMDLPRAGAAERRAEAERKRKAAR